MDSIIIEGGQPLIGDIHISGSKNASLPIMAACLLTDDLVELHNVPVLSDIYTMQKLLENHGCQVEQVLHEGDFGNDSFTLKISSNKVKNFTAPYDIVRKMRASIWVLGPLLSRFGKAHVSHPGGCAIGARLINLHIAVLEAMGADITIEEGYVMASSKNASASGRLKGCNFIFEKISVGATITAILAAVLADGETNLSNCAIELEIVDLCNFLSRMGANIEFSGTNIKIKGVTSLQAVNYEIIPDRIEAGTYMMACMITKGKVNIKGINSSYLTNTIPILQEAGVIITDKGDLIEVSGQNNIKATNISTAPYPGFATDLQAQFMAMMTLADGKSTITETIFENRFMHVPELCRMGAHINIAGNKAIVTGISSLSGAEVMASDLRASVSLIIAGLAAKGLTKVKRVYHLDRGYQRLERKLRSCGARITRTILDIV